MTERQIAAERCVQIALEQIYDDNIDDPSAACAYQAVAELIAKEFGLPKPPDKEREFYNR